MDTIQYGKWGGWIIPVGVLLGFFAVITAQPGFLSISCGGKTNHTAENNITWETDAPYMDVGQAANIGDASELGSYLHTMRYFPKPLNKSCYQLPVTPDVPYLLRLWFVLGNFSGYQQWRYINFAFSIETVDMLLVQHITLSTPFPYEYISVTSGRVIYICLIRNIDINSADPFISAIELRRLQDDLYGKFGVLEAGYALYLQERIDAGGNLTVRYPQDKFDRIWTTSFVLPTSSPVHNVSSAEPVSTNNIPSLVPPVVLQTALVVEESGDIILDGLSANIREDKLLVWYFAEIKRLNASEYSRSFYVVLEGNGNGNSTQLITLPPNQSAVEHHIVCNCVTSIFQLVKVPNSPLSAMINAFEYYTRLKTENATHRPDIDALDAIKRRFGIRDWKSDPCYLRPWSGIGCYNISGLVRVSEIDLSGRNLSGSVPNDIAQLTALVNLYLHNNNLSGTVEWLSEMKNLKELNIANNNFSGVIPGRLLLDCSLKLNYSGNPYLRMNKRKCFAQKSKTSRRNKLIIIISGSLFIGLASIAGMVVYRKKFSKREECAAMGSRSRVEKRRKPLLNRDYSMIIVPNPTKSRAFTLDEMVAATQNFSREIGRGGFGSVFFGRLPEGIVIAVKVLSLFSRQGIHEFLNEVDLLSKINHKNLVSLLGYCNDTEEVMLIYEHMSGGSLRDHLYGGRAENSDLNWKRRLKIALDAAQGLEYLHVGCIPKIIHRDIKTANILLDNNLNGKLADFGLSRMIIDGEATHVTTGVKGTFGYLDPEYYSTQMLTEKSDVYGFGVVLLEIICGRPPIDIKRPEEEVNIVRWVTPYLREMDENSDQIAEIIDNAGRITEIIDKRLCGGYNMKSMIIVAEIAMRCVQVLPSCRPSVREVVAELREGMKHEEDKDSLSIAEEINGIRNGDVLTGGANSNQQREGMEWSENSSNMSKVGR